MRTSWRKNAVESIRACEATEADNRMSSNRAFFIFYSLFAAKILFFFEMCKFIRKIFAYIRKKQYLCSRFLINARGKLAEWSIAAVLKTVDLQGFGGSNPSLSASKTKTCLSEFTQASRFLLYLHRMPSADCWDYEEIPHFPQKLQINLHNSEKSSNFAR